MTDLNPVRSPHGTLILHGETKTIWSPLVFTSAGFWHCCQISVRSYQRRQAEQTRQALDGWLLLGLESPC